MREVWVVSAVRTPIGRFGGALKDFSPVDLGGHVMKAALEQAGLSGAELDLFVFGQVLRAGHGQLPPRQAAFKAGIPNTVDGYAVDMVCASGMQAVANGALAIKNGDAELVLAGGMESMTQTGFYLSSRARWGYKYLAGAPEQLQDILQRDGLSDPFTGEAMGDQTERLAAEFGVTRPELDEVALESHRRAARAQEACYFSREMVPLEVKTRKGLERVEKDEGVRPETTLESLAALRPAFKKDGVLTAGNASQISDGASALLLASPEAVQKHGLKPIARILGSSWAAGEPWRFPEAPIPAVKKLLEKLHMSIADFHLFENNEAFALNNLLFNRLLGVPMDRLNVHGGAIALGHPIGASGARILTTLIHALHTHRQERGLAAICHGTGGSTAMAVEAVG
ncbi:thiolase family protein [Meiothermus ruber]|jgi:acetyl-CoA C-acetyltransferase|uniref:Acetyl-CoA acetyltransferase n=1 Tax=Meiothermus ruber (strain ATCC 35948 / DSM 1279 / VKM B-1258 / 21) TaxID=504728 RepID=D3PT91_MEIRD|nr:thiolase family protein [Meiothermus ruber]QJQ87845.1 acetyl-CoA acetyltransferase [synthetic construct]ADD28674.1 acetyl-CoA acetyltransferase [Meiothermus ruber DSM 1279]AGK05881.1 acetyl-CoA acetyltransferase [Meiothermus ruber DSM 1279]MCL6531000.1 thiolase family protein [Meiothermus ruber]MCX7801808.1 thiolase family protein [Meiothermus ruber]